MEERWERALGLSPKDELVDNGGRNGGTFDTILAW